MSGAVVKSPASSTKPVEKREEIQEVKSEIPNWALYFGIGATVVAAGVATAYIVKTRRDEELKKMRMGGRGVQNATLEDFSPKKATLVTYWNWTVDAFGKVNRFVSHLLKSSQSAPAENPLQVDADELAVYGESSGSDQAE